MESVGERFDQGSFRGTHPGRQANHALFGNRHILGQATLKI
jgi:hypothetical protein